MKPHNAVPLLMMLTLTAANAAFAQQSGNTSRWWLHSGPTHVAFHTATGARIGGTVIPGAGVDASSNTTLAVEVGYDLSTNLAVRLTGGIPPTTKLSGTGALAASGELGQIQYGPAALTLTWAFDGPGMVRPYIGGGLNYTMVLQSRDGSITALNAKSAFGGVLQTGVDVPINKHWGWFLDVKKIYVKTEASGMVGATPASASVRLDPLLIQTGISYRF